MFDLASLFSSRPSHSVKHDILLAPLPAVREDSDDLSGEATGHITIARAHLVEMASNCLNRSPAGHRRDIDRVRGLLVSAVNGGPGAHARRSLCAICNDLVHLADRAAGYDLDQLGDIYCIIEMRLAVILLADIDGRNISGGLFSQSNGDRG